MPITTEIKTWKPERATSKGASAFHDATANSTYIKDILYEIFKIIRPNINKGDTVVDFGAGTGTSGTLLLEHFNNEINLWLVDNSPSWLSKAYEIMHTLPNVNFFVLEKKGERYATLAETVGENSVNHVVSANTFHLIPDIKEVFDGIHLSLKEEGTFLLETGNFTRKDRPEGALMIDDTTQFVHDIAIEMIKKDDRFKSYREGLDERIKKEHTQKKFVFPDPRPIETYVNALKEAKFEPEDPLFIPVRIRYTDWMKFLRVKRLQAGILPEVGGMNPTPEQEHDRDTLITESTQKLFNDLENNNPLANEDHFIVECAYILSYKKKEGEEEDGE
jgi:ubiquinone/menaquinone biosynthesis C-methylase UbiE